MHRSPLKVSPIVRSQGNTHFSIPVKIHVGSEVIATRALIDSGAEGCFIHHRLTRRYRIPTKRLPWSIRVSNVDGTVNQSGNITQLTFQTININDHHSLE